MRITIIFLLLSLSVAGCTAGRDAGAEAAADTLAVRDTAEGAADSVPVDSTSRIEIRKELLYDRHTLGDSYPYRDTVRVFQWDKIRDGLVRVERMQREPARWAILRNYKNRNGEAPLVRDYRRNAYNRIADTAGVERYQSVPLYLPGDTTMPVRYEHDGSPVRVTGDEGSFARVETIKFGGRWLVPKRYLRVLPDSTVFDRVVFVDRTNQNIAALEKSEDAWLVRSMNPATTGLHRPPYQQETPLGLFVVQQKKPKMIYLKDGSAETGGFAPWASRFSDGGYIHGVPVNAPATALIEYSPSLGTTPRSHMCVRNATSHAKFIYDWAPAERSLVFVVE